jgi:hypothetical protein
MENSATYQTKLPEKPAPQMNLATVYTYMFGETAEIIVPPAKHATVVR